MQPCDGEASQPERKEYLWSAAIGSYLNECQLMLLFFEHPSPPPPPSSSPLSLKNVTFTVSEHVGY